MTTFWTKILSTRSLCEGCPDAPSQSFLFSVYFYYLRFYIGVGCTARRFRVLQNRYIDTEYIEELHEIFQAGGPRSDHIRIARSGSIEPDAIMF